MSFELFCARVHLLQLLSHFGINPHLDIGKQVGFAVRFSELATDTDSENCESIESRKMPDIPFVLNLDSPDSMYYGHDMFPNRLYRRMHSRHHDALDLHTLGLIARMGAHAHHLVANKHRAELGGGGAAGKDKRGNFEVNLDVGLFEPGELSVKLVNNCVIIEGKHEEREDEHGHVSRHFVRRYPLPKEYNADAIASTLTDEGVLTITVPPLVAAEEAEERVIPIKHVGPSDLFVQQKNNGHKEQPEGEAK